MIKIQKGDKYGRLTVIKELPRHVTENNTYRLFLCKCECGNKTKVILNNLRTGHTFRDRKSTRLNSSHIHLSRMPSSA